MMELMTPLVRSPTLKGEVGEDVKGVGHHVHHSPPGSVSPHGRAPLQRDESYIPRDLPVTRIDGEGSSGESTWSEERVRAHGGGRCGAAGQHCREGAEDGARARWRSLRWEPRAARMGNQREN